MPRIAIHQPYPTDRPAERTAELSHETDRLWSALLDNLTARQLAVALQLLVCGRSPSEIAADYGIRHQAVDQSRAQAIRRLRDGLS